MLCQRQQKQNHWIYKETVVQEGVLMLLYVRRVCNFPIRHSYKLLLDIGKNNLCNIASNLLFFKGDKLELEDNLMAHNYL